MIKEYAANIAVQIGIQLSKVSFIEGRKVGCKDMHLLNLVAGGHRVSTLVYKSELDDLKDRIYSENLDTKIREALSRLQILLEP